jgi:prophage maintenance system killer protein
MMTEITKLLEEKNLLQRYPIREGSIEIKDGYLYLRKRQGNSLRSEYVGTFTNEAYAELQKNVAEGKRIKKRLRAIEKDLVKQGYERKEISLNVRKSLQLGILNFKNSIHNQAILEGIPTTFPETERIVEDGRGSNLTATEIVKITNLKRAWQFILDEDVIQARSDISMLKTIASIITEGSLMSGDLRIVPVSIRNSTYKPPIPIESVVKENIEQILTAEETVINKAINLCLYCMKAQIFLDGNKRTAVIFANHYLMSQGAGLLLLTEDNLTEFVSLLIKFYETGEKEELVRLFKDKFWCKVD